MKAYSMDLLTTSVTAAMLHLRDKGSRAQPTLVFLSGTGRAKVVADSMSTAAKPP